jgi:hypothetical protein
VGGVIQAPRPDLSLDVERQLLARRGSRLQDGDGMNRPSPRVAEDHEREGRIIGPDTDTADRAWRSPGLGVRLRSMRILEAGGRDGILAEESNSECD